MKLIIAEKPSVAAAIAKVTGSYMWHGGYMEGGGYVVSWCLGHLVELCGPEAYDERYAGWRQEDLPILPEEWKTRVSADKKGQFSTLKELMGRDDITEIIEATDAGREGELIFRLVYEKCGCRKPVQRLWISSLENEAITEGLKCMKPGSGYDHLYEAALCRERADWLVGINATRLFSCLYGETLNVGRVMTPTLAMLAEREAAIRDFVPEPFYTVQVDADGVRAESGRMKEKPEAEKLQAACMADGKLEARKVVQKERTEKPPALYDLTSLQRDANRMYGYTAKQTLDYAQALYEKKLATYPRTDSRYLTEDMESALEGLAAMVRDKYGIRTDGPVTVHAGQVINGAKVTDHHAILPTKMLGQAKPDSLSAGEETILRMIALRLLCATGDVYRYLETDMEFSCGGQTFKAKGRIPVSPGWKEYEPKKDGRAEDGETGSDIQEKLPPVREGQALPLISAQVKEGKTTPPRRYTEDLLLAAMEKAGAGEIPDEAERKGIGTSATRAGIIEKLVQKGFAERKGDKRAKFLVPTGKGESLVKAVPEILKSPSLTAEWEKKLLMVEQGSCGAGQFMEGIRQMVEGLVKEYRGKPGDGIFTGNAKAGGAKDSLGACPFCGSAVADGKAGYSCRNRECRFILWKENRFFDGIGKKMTRDMAEKLIRDGRAELKGCRSAKSGKTFDATAILDVGEDGRASFSLEFGHRKPDKGKPGKNKK